MARHPLKLWLEEVQGPGHGPLAEYVSIFLTDVWYNKAYTATCDPFHPWEELKPWRAPIILPPQPYHKISTYQIKYIHIWNVTCGFSYLGQRTTNRYLGEFSQDIVARSELCAAGEVMAKWWLQIADQANPSSWPFCRNYLSLSPWLVIGGNQWTRRSLTTHKGGHSDRSFLSRGRFLSYGHFVSTFFLPVDIFVQTIAPPQRHFVPLSL